MEGRLDYLPTMASQTSERIADVIAKRSSVLAQLDRYCCIETLFFSKQIGLGAEARMHASILACLPQVPDQRSMTECLQALKNLADGKLYAFCGAGLQSTCSTIRSFLAIFIEGRAPPWHQATESDFFKKGKQCFANFLKYGQPARAEVEATTLYGAEAAAATFTDLHARMGRSNAPKITYEQLAVIVRYKWLLSPEQAVVVEEWVDKSLAQGPADHFEEAEAADQKKAASTKKKKAQNADIKAIVGNLFK